MSQFRKDPFGSAWVIISPERGLEASDFGSIRLEHSHSPLSPGNEAALGSEIRALRPAGSAKDSPDWRIRVVPYPSALLRRGEFELAGSTLFQYAPSIGYQELVIEHPEATMMLESMPHEHLVELLKVYSERLSYLASRANVQHVQLTRSVGRAAGAMYAHPHGHLSALPVKHRWIEEELQASQSYYQQTQRSLFADVIEAELAQRDRVVRYSDHFVALSPFASKTPFETWILPRQGNNAFSSTASNLLMDFADMLCDVIGAINSALDFPPYNLVLHSLPSERNNHYYWHIKLLPQLTKQAGFDWASGLYINPTPPEDAARFLRQALLMREVSS